MGELVITDRDLRNAQQLIDSERILPLTSDNMFRGAVYAMLSAVENYPKQKRVYDHLIRIKLDTPSAVLERKEEVPIELRHARNSNSKSKYLIGLAEYWQTSGIADKLIQDLNNGHENEFTLRKEIADDAPGLAFKCTSIFMTGCGYRRVIAIDSLMLRKLYEWGYPIKPYRDKRKKYSWQGSPDGFTRDNGVTSQKEYLQIEAFANDKAQKHGIDAFTLKQIIHVQESQFLRGHSQLNLGL